MWDAIADFLDGRKTILCFLAVFIVGGCRGLGWINDSTAQALSSIFIGLGGISMRAALDK